MRTNDDSDDKSGGPGHGDGVDDTAELTLGDGTPVTREGQPLGEGGYGDVWALRERPDLAAKIYKRAPGEEQLRRLTAMLRAAPLAEEELQPDQPPLLAWPTDLVESGGRPVGYGMPRLEPSAQTPLKGLLQKQVRLRLDGATDWKFLVGVAANLAYMTARLHVEGFVVGDLSSANAVADRSGYITLLDCDSFAFRDALTNEEFGSDAFTDDYACPERYDGTEPTRHSDDFALAVLVYQLVTAGNHPFDGAPKYGAEESTRKDNILSGTSFLVHPDRVVVPAQLLSAEWCRPGCCGWRRPRSGRGCASRPAGRARRPGWPHSTTSGRTSPGAPGFRRTPTAAISTRVHGAAGSRTGKPTRSRVRPAGWVGRGPRPRRPRRPRPPRCHDPCRPPPEGPAPPPPAPSPPAPRLPVPARRARPARPARHPPAPHPPAARLPAPPRRRPRPPPRPRPPDPGPRRHPPHSHRPPHHHRPARLRRRSPAGRPARHRRRRAPAPRPGTTTSSSWPPPAARSSWCFWCSG
ncbi:hypothetical protein ACFVZA_25380 [Streptomyces bottropensis]|uniref:hypothetical protein n=1 Tax=Streptomyces bottropensis TaxID=42235 RepID=UPI00369A117F